MNVEKVRCSLHPTEPISNFCKRKECMIGLCATCVGEHTKVHTNNHTIPDYENIQSTFQVTDKMLHQHYIMTQKEKKNLENVMGEVQVKKNNLRNLLIQAKKETLAFVEAYYNEILNKYMEKIKQQTIRTGLHNREVLSKMNMQLGRQEEQIKRNIFDLHKYKTPNILKSVHMQILPKCEKTLQKASVQIKKNQTFTPQVVYKSVFLPQLKMQIDKIVSLDFVYPLDGLGNSDKNLRSSCLNFYSGGKVQQYTPLINNLSCVRPQSTSKVNRTEMSMRNSHYGKENSPTMSRISRRSNIFNNSRS